MERRLWTQCWQLELACLHYWDPEIPELQPQYPRLRNLHSWHSRGPLVAPHPTHPTMYLTFSAHVVSQQPVPIDQLLASKIPCQHLPRQGSLPKRQDTPHSTVHAL